MDTREKEILDLQAKGMSRIDISSQYYNGADKKNNLKCLNKFMQRRGYKIFNGKYVKENIDGIQDVGLQQEYIREQKEVNVFQKEYVKIENRLHDLEEKYKQLEDILHACSQVAITTVSRDTETKIKIDLPESNYTKMSSWINSEVWEEWRTFTDSHEEYGKKYLVSQALLDFMKQNK